MKSNAIKKFSMSFSLPISFEVEWHNSQSDKIYLIFGVLKYDFILLLILMFLVLIWIYY